MYFYLIKTKNNIYKIIESESSDSTTLYVDGIQDTGYTVIQVSTDRDTIQSLYEDNINAQIQTIKNDEGLINQECLDVLVGDITKIMNSLYEKGKINDWDIINGLLQELLTGVNMANYSIKHYYEWLYSEEK